MAKIRIVFFLFCFISNFCAAANNYPIKVFPKNELFPLLSRACLEGNIIIITGFIDESYPAKDFLLHARYDEERNTLLHLAMQNKETEIAEHLITQGAPVNLYNSNGWTPLHYAADQDNDKLFKLLIEHGADINAYALNGITPYGIASKQLKLNILTLCRKLDIDHCKIELNNPGAYKSYIVDDEGFANFIGWKCDNDLPEHHAIPQEEILVRQSYFFQLEKTNSAPSLPSFSHSKIDDHWISISADK